MSLTPVSRLAGAALGGLFGSLAGLRRGKPLHPRGAVYDALIRRTGSAEPWGVAWLDTPGEDRGLARLSRAIGLPGRIPDVQGLALTFSGPDGDRHDLLLATTGSAPVARFMLVPTVDAERSFYGSLFPYDTLYGPVLLGASPAARADEPRQGMSFVLLAASLGGPWRQFATVTLTRRLGETADEPLRLDPVLHLLPGLRWPAPLARLREPAYAASRRTPARMRVRNRLPGSCEGASAVGREVPNCPLP